ncbi:hypothetical protein NDU88_002617 [Pleurodeles waltl]|uniref:Uncharacterized protein n=1 Tax=Pleurodeles waltl TaxID=8319 RepID=A0AAV7M306_PLEWA|nr:hypothetical protein NDU88_002617 [Pleurodeles waltl]
MAYRFLHLALVMARLRFAITWMRQRVLDFSCWRSDVLEWSVAEETHIRLSRQDDKVVEDLAIWSDLCDAFLNPEATGTSSNSENVETEESNGDETIGVSEPIKSNLKLSRVNTCGHIDCPYTGLHIFGFTQY